MKVDKESKYEIRIDRVAGYYRSGIYTGGDLIWRGREIWCLPFQPIQEAAEALKRMEWEAFRAEEKTERERDAEAA